DGDDLRAARDRQRDAQRVLVRLGAAVHEEHPLEPFGRETRELLGRLVAHGERQDVALEMQRRRLATDRLGEARMAVAERGDGMPAVEIEHPAAVRVLEPCAFAPDGRVGQGREHPVEVRSPAGGHHSHPGVGAVSPSVSGSPSSRFTHCMLPPAAPLIRLSIAAWTTSASPSAETESIAWLLATMSLSRGGSPVTATNGALR